MNQLFLELVNMIAGGTSNRHFTAAITYVTRVRNSDAPCERHSNEPETDNAVQIEDAAQQ
jgi:hypothetical protein